MFNPPYQYIPEFLNHSEKMEIQAWIVIVADADGSGKALARTLELMNAEVDLVQTETETVTLMRRSKRAPNLLYILADEFCGLERAIRLHQNLHWQSIFRKCTVLSNNVSNPGIDPESSENLLLLKPPEPKCYH